MKAVLEYTLPEEKHEFDLAVNAQKYWLTVNSTLGLIRQKLKYSQLSELEISLLEEIQDHIYEELKEEA